VRSKVAGASFGIVLLFSATGLTLVGLAVANPMWYLPTIVINSDGSVVPQTEFIRQDGNVYTLTADLAQKYAIKIQRSNIVFNGAGHVMTGTVTVYYGPANNGLSLERVTNVTVKGIQVYGFGFSDISLENSRECILLRVKAGSLQLENSNFNRITESSIGDDFNGLGVHGSNNNIFLRNSIASMGVNGEANIIVKNNITSLSTVGYRNNIIANRINHLGSGNNNTYYANDISTLHVSGADNLFCANNFQGNTLPAFEVLTVLYLYGGEVGKPGYEPGRGFQFWDNGLEGNFWGIYKESFDVDGDGISDEPYLVEAKYYDYGLKKELIVDCGIDNYPLMSPFNIESVSFKLPDWSPVVSPEWAITFLSPQNQTYYATDISLNFTVPKSARSVRFSLDGQANVTITENTTLTAVTYGSHNITLYIDDPFGNTSPPETIYFTITKEPEPFPTTLVAAASGTLAIVASVAFLFWMKTKKTRKTPGGDKCE
jgi:hypothetical protein